MCQRPRRRTPGAVGVPLLLPRGRPGSRGGRPHFLSSKKLNIEAGLVAKAKTRNRERGGAEAGLQDADPARNRPRSPSEEARRRRCRRPGSRARQRADPHAPRQAARTDRHLLKPHGRPSGLGLAGTLAAWKGFQRGAVAGARQATVGGGGRPCALETRVSGVEATVTTPHSHDLGRVGGSF